MRSYYIAQGTVSNHLWWNMMEHVRKRMCVCVYVCACVCITGWQHKLTEHCIKKLKTKPKINKKNLYGNTKDPK